MRIVTTISIEVLMGFELRTREQITEGMTEVLRVAEEKCAEQGIDSRLLPRSAFHFEVLGEGSAIVEGREVKGTRCLMRVTAEQEAGEA